MRTLPMMARRTEDVAIELEKLQRVVVRCQKCPRLVDYLEEVSRHKPRRFLDLLRNLKIIVPLGRIAFTQTLTYLRLEGYEIPPLVFGRGKVYPLPSGPTLVLTYHPSQQNTQTGRLTHPMFDRIFKRVREEL